MLESQKRDPTSGDAGSLHTLTPRTGCSGTLLQVGTASPSPSPMEQPACLLEGPTAAGGSPSLLPKAGPVAAAPHPHPVPGPWEGKLGAPPLPVTSPLTCTRASLECLVGWGAPSSMLRADAGSLRQCWQEFHHPPPRLARRSSRFEKDQGFDVGTYLSFTEYPRPRIRASQTMSLY